MQIRKHALYLKYRKSDLDGIRDVRLPFLFYAAIRFVKSLISSAQLLSPILAIPTYKLRVALLLLLLLLLLLIHRGLAAFQSFQVTDHALLIHYSAEIVTVRHVLSVTDFCV